MSATSHESLFNDAIDLHQGEYLAAVARIVREALDARGDE